MKIEIILGSVDATTGLAQQLANKLQNGDTLLLYGPVGVGKTHFARQIIKHRLAFDHIIEDIPSPTFTLVQTYETTRGEIWHSDLYRLTSIDEVDELGLDEAIENAICLIEWPETIENEYRTDALNLRFSIGEGDQRTLTIDWQNEKWNAKLSGLPNPKEGAKNATT